MKLKNKKAEIGNGKNSSLMGILMDMVHTGEVEKTPCGKFKLAAECKKTKSTKLARVETVSERGSRIARLAVMSGKYNKAQREIDKLKTELEASKAAFNIFKKAAK
jgi:hypothetical protein